MFQYFIIFLIILAVKDKLTGNNKACKKTKRNKQRRGTAGTWWDSLNEGDKAWLYEHHK